MFETCLNKQNQIKELFSTCCSSEDRYQKIIELGRELPSLTDVEKVAPNLVKGCQSQMYLFSEFIDGQIFFKAESDALISAGLAALLVQVYSGETPETILKCPPSYLDELGISANLTPNRANGLYSMHLRMKQDALKWLLNQEKKSA
jgi:cysteine desulfuration protein SufE